jgi:hypothetical protein
MSMPVEDQQRRNEQIIEQARSIIEALDVDIAGQHLSPELKTKLVRLRQMLIAQVKSTLYDIKNDPIQDTDHNSLLLGKLHLLTQQLTDTLTLIIVESSEAEVNVRVAEPRDLFHADVNNLSIWTEGELESWMRDVVNHGPDIFRQTQFREGMGLSLALPGRLIAELVANKKYFSQMFGEWLHSGKSEFVKQLRESEVQEQDEYREMLYITLSEFMKAVLNDIKWH